MTTEFYSDEQAAFLFVDNNNYRIINFITSIGMAFIFFSLVTLEGKMF